MRNRILLSLGTLSSLGLVVAPISCAFSPSFAKTTPNLEVSDVFYLKPNPDAPEFTQDFPKKEYLDADKKPLTVDSSWNPIHDGDSFWLKNSPLLGSSQTLVTDTLKSIATFGLSTGNYVDNSQSYPKYKYVSEVPGWKQESMSSNDNKFELRLWGVDTPEISKPLNDGSNQWTETSGDEHKYAVLARDYVRKHIEPNQALYIYPVSWEKYGRLVVDIKYYSTDDPYENHPLRVGSSLEQELAGMHDLSVDLAKAGLARAAYLYNTPSTNYLSYVDRRNQPLINNIYKSQDTAMDKKIGIWSTDQSNWSKIFPKAYTHPKFLRSFRGFNE